MEYKFYRWDDVLVDYTPGGMCAVARSVEEARAAIVKECSYVVEGDLAKEPVVCELSTAPAMVIWGGS